MVSSAKFLTLLLQYVEFFSYLNGFRDLMGFDYIYDMKLEKGKIILSYVKDNKQFNIPLSLPTMKESYESWLKEKK